MATGRHGTKPQQQAAEQDCDPKYEWQENANGYVLRLHLSGFRKEDFRVQVDGAGRLTVRGQRADGGKHSRFNKVFQLPATSNLDGITGRFDAGVLTLTVPKKDASKAPPPPPPQEQGKIKEDEAKKPQAAEHKEEPQMTAKKPKDDAKPKEDASKPPPPQERRKPKEDEAKKPQVEHNEVAQMTTKKPKDDAKTKEDATASKKPPAAAEQQVDAKRGKPEHEQREAVAPPATVGEGEAKPKAEAGAPPAAADKKQAAPRPPQPDAERKAVDPESLAEVTAKRRAEEERAKAAVAAEEAERQRPCRGFKERVQEELQGLAGSEWAEGLVETVKKNKEVIAAAVAAFSLGLFVSSRLFSRN